ncbi:MAG: class I SAM-dependent methyltransferase [Sulfurospirillum sp.]|nr:class I SAM-dependent methyltransferase [Sulfurospirillum sp.]
MQKMWNEKFSREDFLYGEEPNEFIKSQAHLFSKQSHILCLGEGEGRNALYLATQGHYVEALDASDVGLAKLHNKAKIAQVTLDIRHTLFENWEPHKSYDAIISSYFHLPKDKQQELFLKSFFALREGGYFVAEFFSTHHLKYKSFGPKDPNLLYDICDTAILLKNLPCEIIKLSQEIIQLNEGVGHTGKASVIRIVFMRLKNL